MRTLRIIPLLFVSVLALGAASCVPKTQFLGSAHVPGGVGGCHAACSQQNMEVAGMVIMGEYTDGCICKVPGTSDATADRLVILGANAAAGAAAGVRSQMDDEEEQQRQQQNQNNSTNQ